MGPADKKTIGTGFPLEEGFPVEIFQLDQIHTAINLMAEAGSVRNVEFHVMQLQIAGNKGNKHPSNFDLRSGNIPQSLVEIVKGYAVQSKVADTQYSHYNCYAYNEFFMFHNNSLGSKISRPRQKRWIIWRSSPR